jgi:hypothetical protein
MPNLLQRSATWHGGQMKSAAGRTVEVRQGESIQDGLTAWHQLVNYEVVDNEGYGTSVQAWEWRFLVADLTDGFAFREGDLIVETNADQTATHYQVLPVGGRPCVENADSSGLQLTVRTKRVT